MGKWSELEYSIRMLVHMTRNCRLLKVFGFLILIHVWEEKPSVLFSASQLVLPLFCLSESV